jgi:hypothetical protein
VLGRASADVVGWLRAQDEAFRAGVEFVAIDPCVRPRSVQASGGMLFLRLPTSLIGVALFRFAYPSGAVPGVWLQRGLRSS